MGSPEESGKSGVGRGDMVRDGEGAGVWGLPGVRG